MSFRLFILRLFNVRSKEVWLVKSLFSFKFLQGISIEIFFATALIIFLKNYDVRNLPLIYIFSSLLLWVVGFAYTKVEHALSVKNLVLVSILFMAATILALLVTFYLVKDFWVFALLLSWFQVLYLVSGLEFWGLSSLLFDVRQSKRLFSMISAGDMVPKAIGFMALPALILLLGGSNIFLLSFFFMCSSLLIWKRFDSHGTFKVQMQHHHVSNPGVKSIFDHFFQNKLIFHLASLSIVRVILTTLISFCYLARVKMAAHSNHELDLFVITFLAVGAILTVVMKTLFTGRIIANLGIRRSMFLKPVVLIAIFSFIIIYSRFNPAGNSLLYLFGIAAVINEVINYAILIPLLLSLMQPLPSELRLKAHTLVKGIMDPLALLVSGIFLYEMYKLEGNLDVVHLCYFLLGLLVLWMFLVVRVEKEYLKELTDALKKKYLHGVDLEIKDERTMKLFKETLNRQEENSSIFILGMIEKYYEPALDKLVMNALASSSPNIKAAALEVIENKRILSAYTEVKKIMDCDNDTLKMQAFKTLYALQDSDNLGEEMNWETNPELLKLKLVGILRYRENIQHALTKIAELVNGGTEQERIIAAQVLNAVDNLESREFILRLLHDPSSAVVQEALKSLPRHPGPKITQVLEEQFNRRPSPELFLAITKCGEAGFKFLKAYFADPNIPEKDLKPYIRLCGLEGSDNSHAILTEWIETRPRLHSEILHALRQSHYRLDGENETKFLQWCNFYLGRAVKMIDMMHSNMVLKKDKRITSAIMNDLDLLIEKLLHLFSLLYDEEKIMRVQHGLQSGKREDVANAMEIIELSVKKEHALEFNMILEKKLSLKEGDIHAHHTGFHRLPQNFIRHIFEENSFVFTRWTQAIVMYTLTPEEVKQNTPIITRFASVSDELLSETANFVLSKSA